MTETITHRGSRPVNKEFTILMASLMSVVAISIDAMLPALGIMGQDLQVVFPNQAQYIISFLFIGMAIGQLVCGPLSDAIGRKRVLYWSIVLYLVGSVIGYLADSLGMMLVGRVIQGIGVAGPYISTMSIIRDRYHGREMARIMSLVMMIFIMVPAVAPTLGQGILFFASWRYIFVTYIIYAIVIVVWLFFRLEETLPIEKRIPFSIAAIKNGFWEVTSNRITISYTICMGFLFGSFMGYLNASRQIFQVQFSTGKMFTVYFGCLALVFGAASLLNSHLVEKLGMRYLCKRGLFGIVIASVIFLCVHWLADIHLWMFLLYAAVIFFTLGLLFGNLNALAMEPMGHVAGIASAIIGAVSSVISMSLGTIIGQMYNNTLVPIVTGFLLLGILSIVMMFYAEQK